VSVGRAVETRDLIDEVLKLADGAEDAHVFAGLVSAGFAVADRNSTGTD
jgi:hypothetical protein